MHYGDSIQLTDLSGTTLSEDVSVKLSTYENTAEELTRNEDYILEGNKLTLTCKNKLRSGNVVYVHAGDGIDGRDAYILIDETGTLDLRDDDKESGVYAELNTPISLTVNGEPITGGELTITSQIGGKHNIIEEEWGFYTWEDGKLTILEEMFAGDRLICTFTDEDGTSYKGTVHLKYVPETEPVPELTVEVEKTTFSKSADLVDDQAYYIDFVLKKDGEVVNNRFMVWGDVEKTPEAISISGSNYLSPLDENTGTWRCTITPMTLRSMGNKFYMFVGYLRCREGLCLIDTSVWQMIEITFTD